MKNRNYKRLVLALVFLLFIVVPFMNFSLFSSSKSGKIEVNKDISADFIQSDKNIVLLFFGYVGCQDVCTPILQNLNTLYQSKEFSAIKDSVDVLFVNLTPQIEPFQPDLFAKYFNQDFQGVYLSKKEIFRLDRSFGLFFSQSLNDLDTLNHTDNIYLLQKTSKKLVLKNIYLTHPLNLEILIADIKVLQSEINKGKYF